jgi:hypothetical protein
LFGTGGVSLILIQTPLNILANLLTPDGFISESFDVSAKYNSIIEDLQEILEKISPSLKVSEDIVPLSACTLNEGQSAAIFEELNGFCGIAGHYVYDPANKNSLSKALPPEVEENKVVDFLSFYLKKQQMGMDIVPDLVVFYAGDKNILLFTHNNLYLICFANQLLDLNFIFDKIKETWVRFDIGV